MAVTLSGGIKVNSQSVSGNYSNVTIWVDAISTYGSHNAMNPPGSITINGPTGSVTRSFNHSFNANTTTRIYTTTMNLIHKSDGSGSASFSCSFDTQVSSGTVRLSKSLTLPTIARASVPTASGTKELGSTITIATNRRSSSFTHTIKWSWAGQSGTIATGVGTSTTWTPDVETFAPYLTTATSSKCTITCTTYNGSTNIGSKTVSFDLAIPSTVVPSFTSATLSDDTTYFSTYDAYVQNWSVIKLDALATSPYGATITKYTAALDGLSVEGTTGSLTIGTPPLSGERSITITATDSRGRTITGTKSLTVAAYSQPTLSASAYRVGSNGVEDDESTTVRVAFSGSVCNVNSKGLGSSTVTIKYQPPDGEQQTALSQVLGLTFSLSKDIENLPNTQNFYIFVSVADQFGTTVEQDFMIGTARPVMDIKNGGEGIAFFSISDENLVKTGKSVKMVVPNEETDGAKLTMQWQNADGGYYGGDMISVGGTNGTANPEIFGDLNGGDRVRMMQHLSLENSKYLLGRLTNGTDVQMLGMNSSGQVELNWTSGGLGGRALKEIWSGTLNRNGTVTIQELPYYKVFLVTVYSWGELIGIKNDYAYKAGVIDHMKLVAYQLIQDTNNFSASATACELWIDSTGVELTHKGATQRTINGSWQSSASDAITSIRGVL